MQLQRLGPYEIGKPLGKGGMGSVYEAVDTSTGRRVAVKALTPHLATAEGFRERFDAEIESLKTLRHEGIVRLYGYGEQDGVLFYSMELVEGVSLEDEMKAGRRFNWREVTSIAIQLCLALKHAHDHGIIHRDIKPANILLYNEDRVKLADFGIARLFGSTQLTTAGGVLGTADYMSPEQADGRPITARCDQYSLGGVMYALLAGRPPFRAKSLPQMLQLQRFAQPEPVRRYAPDTPEQLQHVVQQLLAKDPAERFPNTQVLARHLQAMYKALTRPAADDFALANDRDRPIPGAAEWECSLAVAPTRSEADEESRRRGAPPPDGLSAERRPSTPASQAAVTMAMEGGSASAISRAEPTPSAQSPARPGGPFDTTQAAAAPKRAHFTTIEEEEARRQAEQRRSWILVAAHFAALVALLAGMAAVAFYLSRPLTADDLYRSIDSAAQSAGDDSLSAVERQVDEFLARFPEDPRAAEVQAHQERIALDKAESRLQRRARSGRFLEPDLLPVETIYLRAVNLADDSPEDAIAMLASLVDLYGKHDGARESIAAADAGDPESYAVASDTGPPPEGPSSEEVQRRMACVQLAERRLEALRADYAQHVEQQQTLLRERLDAAERLTIDQPQRAAAIYRAIVDLYGEQAWAEDVVAEAQRRLAD